MNDRGSVNNNAVTPFYLEDFGAVFKGVRVADIIDQADNVTGQISIRQIVKVREYFMKLIEEERRGES